MCVSSQHWQRDVGGQAGAHTLLSVDRGDGGMNGGEDGGMEKEKGGGKLKIRSIDPALI